MKKILLSLLLLVNFSQKSFADIQVSDVMAKLNVRGEAVIEKPADQYELNIGVVTQDSDPDLALQSNNQKMQQVIESIKTLGFDHSEYQTGHFYIQPIYHFTKEDTSEKKQVLDHYEVVNSIQITSQKLQLADQVINVATKNGANQINSINFNLNNPQAYRAEAIAAAVQNAFQDAQILAKAAHVRLIRLVDISLDQPQNRFYKSMAITSADRSISTPLEAGTIDVRASVQAVFEIAP